MLTPEALASEVNAPDASTDLLTRLISIATTLIREIVGTREVPDIITEQATLMTAADLWAQREAPNGLQIYSDGLGGQQVARVRSSATIRARALLEPWIPPVVIV